MPAEDEVDTGYATGELDRSTSMPLCDSRITASGCSSLTDAFDQLGQLILADAEGPVGDKALGVGDRRVGKGLADHCHAVAVELPHRVRLEDVAADVVVYRHALEQRIFGGIGVVREEFALEGFDVVEHLVLAVGELPVPGHDIHAEEIGGLDHIATAGPQRGARTLPGIAAVEEQAGAIGDAPHATGRPGSSGARSRRRDRTSRLPG
jgi:hypothetical protein